MLWLALHFPHLALDALTRGVGGAGSLAVASSAGSATRIVACSQGAAARGVRPSMAVPAAWALASDLEVLIRDEAAERAALERLAAWALQFTPVVSIAAADALLEVQGSLKLFGGLSPLCRRIEQGLAEIGYDACIACAPTPLAAQLFARAGLAARIRHRDALRHELQKLSLDVLDYPPELTATLRNFGVRTIGECLQLPRDGVARRLGQQLLDDLDRALGRLPDPRLPFVPPARFKSSLALPAPVEQAEALLFGAHRLLAELCGWLVATGRGAQNLRWVLAHEHHADTRIDMALVAASRDPEHLLSVLRERLARVAFPRPVAAVTLSTDTFQPLAPHNLSFLPEARHRTESITRLVERLRARLGDEAICGLATHADHRPERAWRPHRPCDGNAPESGRGWPSRPLWLLASPQPLKEISAVPHYDGPLSLIVGPERIEAGWWDGIEIARDYFVACNPAQSLLWIYRERNAPGGWYLHGFFG